MTLIASIVTISLNQGAYLNRALDSVLSQDYPFVEYIVVDPGSTDGSRRLLDEYRTRISHLVLDADTGPAEGLNHGLSVATGDVFAYVNADDALLPGAVREAVEYFVANPTVDVVYGDGYVVDSDGNVLRTLESAPFNLRRFVYGGASIVQPATFVRRAAVDRVGGFSEDNRTCWDAELLVDIALRGGRMKHVRRCWAAFSVYPGTISSSQKLSRQREADAARLFLKVVGRQPTRVDEVLRGLARIEGWFAAPGRACRRAYEVVAGPPRLRLARGTVPTFERRVDG